MLVVLCVALYGRVVTFDFVWDDYDLVADNPYLRQPGTPLRVFRSDFWALSQADSRSGMYRPLVTLSYWVEFRVFGRAPAPFHATNLLLHVGVCLLVLALARRLGAPPWGALLGAALFAAHPAQTEAVAAIASRTDLLATLLLLGGVLLWLRPHRVRWVALLLLFAAMLAKESALVGPILVLFLAPHARPEAPGGAPDEAPGDVPGGWRALAPLAVLPAYVALRLAVLGVPALGGAALRDTSGGLRCFRYAARVLLPLPQPAIEPLERAAPLLVAASAVGIVLLVVLLVRRRASVFAALGAWFLVALAPVAEIVTIGVRFSDLMLYLPLVALGHAAAGFVGVRPARWRYALVAALVAAAATVTTLRLPVWRDGVSLWSHGLRLDPHSPRMLVNLGTALRAQGRSLEGCQVLARALAEIPGRPDADAHVRVLYNLGNCYRERGHLERAAAHYREALERSQGQLEPAAQNLAVALSQLGRDAEALALVQGRVSRNPRLAPLWQRQATLQARLGQRDEAIRSCAEALRLEPGNREVAAMLETLRAGAAR
ncbi:MAG: tetratricopeptide repeat protein [Deltaproteobacteria bacterium]|nr:tetratricopeptide repeat protein [Deltaproteobacteria bacterium]